MVRASKKQKGESHASSTIRREVGFARKRLGPPRGQLRWLLDFAYADLKQLSGGQLTDLGWEFAAFGYGDHDLDHPLEQPIELHVKFDLEPVVRVSIEELQTFQPIIKNGFEAFFHGQGWELTKPSVFERLKMDQRPFELESVKEGFPPAQQKRIRYAYDLVKSHWDRLTLCENPDCRRPFVVEKKGRGRFCTPRCSTTVRVARFRRQQKQAKPR